MAGIALQGIALPSVVAAWGGAVCGRAPPEAVAEAAAAAAEAEAAAEAAEAEVEAVKAGAEAVEGDACASVVEGGSRSAHPPKGVVNPAAESSEAKGVRGAT